MLCPKGFNSSSALISPSLEDECFLDILSLFSPVIFSLGGIVLLLIVHFCGKHRKTKHVWTHFPGHVVRWLIFLGLYITNLAEIGEGVLSNSFSSTVHTHLYVTPCVFLCANIIANVFYHRIEMFGHSKLLLWLVFYWVTALITKLLKWNFTIAEGLNVIYMRFDLTFDNVAAYLAMIVLDVYVVIKLKYICRSQSTIDPGATFKSKDYVYNYACFPSKVLFHWLNTFLWSGYKKPLVLTDLGTLPESEWCTTNFSKFKKIFTKERKLRNGEVTSSLLWKCYLKCNWPMLVLAGFYKLVGDLMVISCPICLKGLVSFVEQSVLTEPANGTEILQEKYYVDFIEFYTHGYVLVAIIFLAALFGNTFLQAHHHLCIRDGVRLKMSLQALIYEKTMQLSSWSLTQGSMTQGQIVNHLAVDTQHVMLFFYIVHYNWSMTLNVVLVLLLLYLQLGYSGMLGAGIMLCFLPVQYILAQLLVKFQKKMLEVSDDRMKKVNELFQGIKLIKLYAWEGIFCGLINDVRWRQIRLLFKAACVNALNSLVNQGIPVIVTLVTFSFYTYIEGQVLTASVAFSALALFNIMARVLMMFPMIVRHDANALVSTGRICKFLNSPEVQRTWEGYGNQDGHVGFSNGHLTQKEGNGLPATDTIDSNKTAHTSGPQACDPTAALTVDSGHFTWDLKEKKPYLSDVNFTAKKGELTMIVGSVGSGKTSLLAALLGEMYKVSGSITWSCGSSVAYATQRPWLINASLKDNILFGRPFDTHRYREIVEVCALEQDISMLPAGDETEIGEKGINLSGGQKARVSLARAMYSGAQVLILDDPFSALDMHVGSHIFEKGIVNLLLGNKRTVILVTHHLQYMTQAHMIYRLDNGEITHSGNLNDIKSNHPELFDTWQALDKRVRTESEMSGPGSNHSFSTRQQDAEFLKKQLRSCISTSVSENYNEEEYDCQSFGSGIFSPAISVSSMIEPATQRRSVLLRSPKLISRQKSYKDATGSQESIPLMEKHGKTKGGGLVTEEERETGSVSAKIYLMYMKAYSVVLFVVVILLKLGESASLIGTNFWLAKWSGASVGNSSEYNANSTAGSEAVNTTQSPGEDTLYYIRGYSLLSCLTLSLTLFSCIVFYLAGVRASAKLHRKMLSNVVKAPMRYFDTTPTGRILNRFSGDIGVIDEKLIDSLYRFLFTVLQFVSAFIVNSIATPLFLVIVAPSVVIYYFLQKFFRASSRELQRLDSIAKSPVLAHFSESIGGLETIRAYGQQDRFMETMFDKINTNTTTFLWLNTVNRWLGIRLDHLGAVIVLGASLCGLLAGMYGYISAGLVGLAVAYSLNVCNYLNWVVRCVAETEMHMNAVERVSHYSNINTEPSTLNTDSKDKSSQDDDWPKHGQVVYKDVSLRYDADLDTVVHGINLSIGAGEKIGICGRTGSGKSTLTLGLFRLINKSEGQIYIDGIDIDRVPLHILRKRIAIIPQDPVLFGGTARFNLDPDGKKTDSELWEALEIAQLKDVISAHGQQLENLVSEGGENYSVGQRQLFCLARAFLKKSSILVMDEATSSIDHQTDKMVQQVIHTAFRDSTVITIAHRVSTIMDYDRVVVLSEGQILECDSPANLLQLPNSLFSSLTKKH